MSDTGAKTAAGPDRLGQVSEQLDRGQRLLEQLHSSIQRLQERFKTVTRCESEGLEGAETHTGTHVGLAAVMREQNMKMESAIEMINNLIERCEL